MVDFRVSVVLPAAGIGSRMGCVTPKQYLKILDRPLLSYTIEALESTPWIESIVVVGAPAENQKQILENIVLNFNHKKVVTTCGDSTRHGSIYNGLRCLVTSEQKPDVVLIHDAVRPFIEECLLKEIVIAARKHGACGVVRPLVSTVLVRDANGFLDHSLDRSKFVASEMPQAFQYDVILNAYQKCTKDDFEFGTECLHLALKYSNVKAFLVDGPDYLWKVTHRKDMFAAEGIIKERLRRRAVFSGNISHQELERVVREQFNTKGVEVQSIEEIELCRVNVLVNFSLLEQYRCSDNDLSSNGNDIILKDLQCIERNGILVIVHCGGEEELAELRKTTKHISRKSRKEFVICCGVWSENFPPLLPKKILHEKLVHFSNMIVSVALETSQTLNGQVFTVLDME